MGLIVVVIITVTEWSRGKKLEMDTTVANLAVVFLLFNSCNFFLYYGYIMLMQFLTVIERASTVFEMEENTFHRDSKVSPD
jgi:hypothetical protein